MENFSSVGWFSLINERAENKIWATKKELIYIPRTTNVEIVIAFSSFYRHDSAKLFSILERSETSSPSNDLSVGTRVFFYSRLFYDRSHSIFHFTAGCHDLFIVLKSKLTLSTRYSLVFPSINIEKNTHSTLHKKKLTDRKFWWYFERMNLIFVIKIELFCHSSQWSTWMRMKIIVEITIKLCLEKHRL